MHAARDGEMRPPLAAHVTNVTEIMPGFAMELVPVCDDSAQRTEPRTQVNPMTS